MKLHSTQYVFFGPSIQIFLAPTCTRPLPTYIISSVFFFSSFFVFLLFFCWPPSPTFEGVLNTSYRALSGACFSCLLAHVFSPAWFCIKPRSTVLHVLLFTNLRTMSIFFILEVLREWITLVLCSAAIEQIRNLNLPSIDSGAEESTIYFLLYNSKVKPCGRTTQFSAGLHCQARN